MMDRAQEMKLQHELKRNNKQIEEAMALALRLEARNEEIKQLFSA